MESKVEVIIFNTDRDKDVRSHYNVKDIFDVKFLNLLCTPLLTSLSLSVLKILTLNFQEMLGRGCTIMYYHPNFLSIILKYLIILLSFQQYSHKILTYVAVNLYYSFMLKK